MPVTALPPQPPAIVCPADPAGGLALDSHIRFLPDKPFTKALCESPNLRIVLFALKAGQTVATHTAKADVLMLVHTGSGTFNVGEQATEAGIGTVVPSGFAVPHGFTAGKDGLVVVAFIAPNPMWGKSEHKH